MNMKILSYVNKKRCESKEGGFGHALSDQERWSLVDWSNAIAGEAGEACNLAKKIKRLLSGIPGNKSGDRDLADLKQRLIDEWADVLIYCDLAIQAAGGDTEEAVRSKFNRKSEELGITDVTLFL